MPDISAILGSTKVALEKQAADTFGSAVETFARGTLGLGPQLVPGTRIPNRDPSSWYASSYAAALSGTSYRPKLKFLFKVEFIFAPEAVAAYPFLKSNDFTFMIKGVDRPKVDFEYEDDVNQYNFRTKVLKKIRNRELTITFMDDVGNRVFDFFRTLMFLHSPVTQRAAFRDGTTTPPTPLSVTEGNGMAFTSVDSLGQPTLLDTAHRGVINSNVGGSISVIRVKQMFMDPDASNINDAPKEVTYDFMNPRIMSFDLDDLTHDSSDPNLLTMVFDYDWLEMVKVGVLKGADTPTYNIATKGITNAPVDILSGRNPPTDTRTGSNPIASAGGENPFLAIIANQTRRAAQKVTNDLIGKAVKSIGGTGPFATDIAGRLTDNIGGAVSGIVGGASRDLLTSAASSVKSSYNTLTRPAASDSATRTDDNATIVTSIDTGGQF